MNPWRQGGLRPKWDFLYYQVKEGFQLRVSASFGGLGVILCDQLQKMQDVFATDRHKVATSKKFLEIVYQVTEAYNSARFKV